MLTVLFTLLTSSASGFDMVGCEAEQVDALLIKLAEVPQDFRLVTAVGGVAKACKLPPTVEDAMREFVRAPVSKRPAWEHNAALDNAGVWSSACVGGAGALPSRAELYTVAARRKVYSGCKLSRFTFANADQFASADGTVVFTVLTAQLFYNHNMPHEKGDPLLRALAGVPEPPKPEPPPEK